MYKKWHCIDFSDIKINQRDWGSNQLEFEVYQIKANRLSLSIIKFS